MRQKGIRIEQQAAALPQTQTRQNTKLIKHKRCRDSSMMTMIVHILEQMIDDLSGAAHSNWECGMDRAYTMHERTN